MSGLQEQGKETYLGNVQFPNRSIVDPRHDDFFCLTTNCVDMGTIEELDESSGRNSGGV